MRANLTADLAGACQSRQAGDFSGLARRRGAATVLVGGLALSSAGRQSSAPPLADQEIDRLLTPLVAIAALSLVAERNESIVKVAGGRHVDTDAGVGIGSDSRYPWHVVDVASSRTM